MALLDLLKFVTTGSWGAGLGRVLTAAEADGNIYNLADAVQEIIDNPVEGVSVTNISVSGRQVTFYMSDATEFGPFDLPFANPRYRGEWVTATSYSAFDIIEVAGYGTYLVAVDHTSDTTFDPLESNSAGDYYIQIAADASVLTGQVKPLLSFRPTENEAPVENSDTSAATADSRNARPVLDFDDATQQTAIFSSVLPPSYAGGGLTVDLWWGATSATTGTVGWDVAIERVNVSGLDTDSDSFATAKTVTAATVPSTSGQIKKSTVALTAGAEMDSLVAGEFFRLRVRRDVATDTATGDAELFHVAIRET